MEGGSFSHDIIKYTSYEIGKQTREIDLVREKRDNLPIPQAGSTSIQDPKKKSGSVKQSLGTVGQGGNNSCTICSLLQAIIRISTIMAQSCEELHIVRFVRKPYDGTDVPRKRNPS